MKIPFATFLFALWMVARCCVPVPVGAQYIQAISRLSPSEPSSAGGNGNCSVPIISGDGTFVVFASMANNLTLATNNAPIPLRLPGVMNVFIRNRTSGVTSLVSINLSGVDGGNSDSWPIDVSSDGRFVLFESRASDLVARDTNALADIFLRDLASGTTTLVNVSTNGGFANGVSRNPAMTPDGRYVVFVSAANNLVPGDTNRIPDIFVRDLQTRTTSVASVGAAARTTSPGTPYSSEAPEITPDGRYVVFYSTATNLVPGVPMGGDVYVRDLMNGSTTWASFGARSFLGTGPNSTNYAYNARISADGQFVAYQASGAGRSGLILRFNLATSATELVHTNAFVPIGLYEDTRNLDMTPDGRFIAFAANTNGTTGLSTCVEVWDSQSGTLALASADLSGLAATNSFSDWPTLDPSGRYVAFNSNAPNLVTNSVLPGFHLYVRDLQSDSTALVDANTDSSAAGVEPSTIPHLTQDGRLIVFECPDAGLVQNDRNRGEDVFVCDWQTRTAEIISASEPAHSARTPNGVSLCTLNSISYDGQVVAFASEADNLVSNDTNGCRDIYVRNLAGDRPVLVSADTNGIPADGVSSEPSISPDGRFVAFSSMADNLVPGDSNRFQDVFLRDLLTGTNLLVSASYGSATSANNNSYAPVVSRDGRFVLFRSRANNLVNPGTVSTYENLFLRDMAAQTNYALTTTGSGPAAMTPDGALVAYLSSSISSINGFYVWDSARAARIYTNTSFSGTVGSVAISEDGQRTAFSVSGALVFVQLTEMSSRIITNIVASRFPSLRLSGNGGLAVCTQTGTSGGNVFLYDWQSGTNLMVSRTYTGGVPTLTSDSPDINAEGRLIAYRSLATNILSGDTNGTPDVFLYDVVSGSTSILNTSPAGNPAGNRSLLPVFSGDGRTLFFQSWAQLDPQDFNRYNDVLAYSLLYALIFPPDLIGRGPWLSWPATPGRNYRVEYKDNLPDSQWRPLGGSVTNSGNRAWLQDPAPQASQRFYRITGF